jgi:hypothetical protein
VQAVNNLGDFGRWDFLVCRDLDRLLSSLADLAGVKDYTPPAGVAVKKEGTLFG